MARHKIQRRVSLRTDRNTFERSSKELPGRESVLIVCEDEKNAPQYFQALCRQLRISSATISPDSGSAPISVVDFAEQKYRRDNGYDKVFCVFDRDQHESYDRAIQKIDALSAREQNPMPVSAGIAIPCFELWFLLHFERTTRPMRTCDEVIGALTKHVPGYVKGKTDITEKLLPLTQQAISNAIWLRKEHKKTGAGNPVTTVHQVVSYLVNLSKVE